MITIIDIETTMKGVDKSPSPYHPSNYLVSVGWKCEDAFDEYVCIKHDDEPPTPNASMDLQAVLDKTDLLVAHNTKFDLSWLLECGFTYENEIYDTMGYEYLKAGGTHLPLDLSSCCSRRGLPVKVDATKAYIRDGIGFESMPWAVVEEYGRNDVKITWDLYWAQQEELNARSS